MRKLYRSTRDRKLFGVCGGLADYLGVDATMLRILLIIVAVFSGGTIILVYIIAGFIIPRESDPRFDGFGGGPAGPYGGPYDQAWRGPEQPYHGGYQGQAQHQGGWNPNSGSSHGSYSAAGAPRPGPTPTAQPAASRPSQGLDAMMEDIEKKSMQKEIEELKARISKFEKESKGE